MPYSSQEQITLPTLHIRDKDFVFGKRTFVMGIVNVTPDSFSHDGIIDTDGAVSYALRQIEKGADIIDIGGQSARPGFTPIDEETEIKRIIPVIRHLRKVSDVVISIDTYSPGVLEQALAAGADMLNSIWGLTDELLQLIRRQLVPVVIMHNKADSNNHLRYAGGCNPPLQVNAETQKDSQVEAARNDSLLHRQNESSCHTEPIVSHTQTTASHTQVIVSAVIDYLAAAANKALAAGLAREQIILDPGIGFGKTADDNLELLTQFNKIIALGFPTLVGTSRKSTIGKLIDRPVDQRVFGTAATVAFAIAHGVDIVRVHDVEEMIDVVKVSDALVRRWRPNNWQG